MEKTLIQLLEKAKQFHLLGKLSEAQKIYLNLIKKNKNNGQLYFLLGTSFLQTKKYDLAIKNLNISIKLNPKISDSYNNIGIALAEIGDYENCKNYNEENKKHLIGLFIQYSPFVLILIHIQILTHNSWENAATIPFLSGP